MVILSISLTKPVRLVYLDSFRGIFDTCQLVRLSDHLNQLKTSLATLGKPENKLNTSLHR